MISRRARFAIALSIAPLFASAADVWVASATEKIRPDAQPRQTTEARIAAARNEFEAFQVVVTGPAHGVSARATSLEGPGVVDDVKLYRVDMIDLHTPSALDGATGRWPDALVPDVDDVVGEQRNAFPFDVAAGESRAIWVEVRVPPDAKPGSYFGKVTVKTDEGEAQIPVALTAWDFQLPSTASLKTHFGLAFGLIPGGHGVSWEGDADIRARYAALGLDHRVSLSGVADDGHHGDFDHFERYYAPLVDGTANTRLPGAKLTTVKYVGNQTSVDEHRRWAEHFRAKGWFDRLFDYTCDEPPLTCSWEELPARTQAVHSADPEFKTLVTTQVWDAEAHGVADQIDIMVPVVNWIDDKPNGDFPGDNRAKYDGFLAQSSQKELWLYQSCMSHGCGGTVNIGNPSEWDQYNTGWPTYMIDASAVRNRAMEWISFLEGATGELYWETAFAFTHDAWTNQWDFSGNGDGTLFYPGTPAHIGGSTSIPVASIRLKMVREGMEDYEYLKLLADAGKKDVAERIARDLFPSAWQTEVDPAKVMAAREALAMQIISVNGKQLASVGVSAFPVVDGAGGGCGSSGGFGAGALLSLPSLVAMALRRRRRRGR
ncbi:MAG TPA: glycoside hydrolase domain-containing protein [Anaeromyxobacter sp.]|nr:glycoside hydrolase domain-containing protein [Anaeromyxobacter sp.]